jgi:hypothetical protein
MLTLGANSHHSIAPSRHLESQVETLLERLSSGQIVAVISILVGGIVALAMIFAITKYQFQALADETALNREKQQAQITLKQKMIERGANGATAASDLDSLLALDVPPETASVLDAELATRFGYLEADADRIERTLRRALAADPERKRAIRSVIDELVSNDAPHDAILAAVGALCDSKQPVACG